MLRLIFSRFKEAAVKKLKLNLDHIKVSTFDAGAEGRGGTVHAHTYTYPSGDQCHTGLQDSCYSCPAPPYCNPQPISWDFNC